MEIIAQLVSFIKELFSWWFIVTPWEQVVFVRAGKHVKVLKEGFYLKIPFIDQIYIQAIRLRIVDLSMQTISTKDKRTLTFKSIMGYSITDIYKMYNTISHPEMTLSGIVLSAITNYVRTRDYDDIDQQELENNVLNQLKDNDYGLGDLFVRITSWAEVKTYRLIQDQSWLSEGMSMDKVQK